MHEITDHCYMLLSHASVLIFSSSVFVRSFGNHCCRLISCTSVLISFLSVFVIICLNGYVMDTIHIYRPAQLYSLMASRQCFITINMFVINCQMVVFACHVVVLACQMVVLDCQWLYLTVDTLLYI